VDDRAIPGHWEGDLIAGPKYTYIATLVEQQSRFTMLVKVPGKDTTSAVTALSQHVGTLPLGITSIVDLGSRNGIGPAQTIDGRYRVQVYCCDPPQSPWQRGTNENTNRLLRQYLPKGTDLSCYSQANLNTIALRLNQRPREASDFRLQRLYWRRPLQPPLNPPIYSLTDPPHRQDPSLWHRMGEHPRPLTREGGYSTFTR